MKDAEFIELLNLYVDQEISATDAARLEAEVQGNPARRRTYQQYCRMQKACKLLTQDFQTSTAPVADRKVVAFKPAARRATPAAAFAAIGALAAAACLAVIFVNRDHTGGTSSVTVAQENPAPVQAPIIAVNAGTTGGIVHAVSVPRAQPAMVGNPLLLSGRANTDAIIAAAAEQANSQFAWMKSVQLPPLQRVPLEYFRYDPPAVQADGSRTFRSPHATEGTVDWAAFRFTK